MCLLKLHLLGPFQATLKGEPVAEFRSDKVRGLFTYLAMASDRPQRREALAGLLWPNTSDRLARNNLRLSLHRLRQALDDLDRESHYFDITRETIQIRSGAIWVDALAFDQLLSTCQTHHHARLERCNPCMARYTEAAALERGDFMQGFFLDDCLAYSEWLLLTRERYHRQILTVLANLSSYYRQQGKLDRARVYAQRQLAYEPWREEAHRQLMDIYARSGETSAALTQFESCQRVLSEELGVEPDKTTIQLRERIQLMRDRPVHNLPPQATPFIGRQTELTRIVDILANPEGRLVTILGPGGVGKTRLAIQAARQIANPRARTFLHGVAFVPLAGVEESQHLVHAIANVLGHSISERHSPEEQLVNTLRRLELLLVLDSFDQVQEGPVVLQSILEAAPDVRMLVTSRVRLNLSGEWLIPLEGLPFPDLKTQTTDNQELGSYPAVQLFLMCAQRVQPEFILEKNTIESVIKICQAVEGLPLGLELAAAWAGSLPVASIASQIASNLDFSARMKDHRPIRHRSLRAVFDHSWRYLDEEERTVFKQLAAFQGGFTLDAASSVIHLETPISGQQPDVEGLEVLPWLTSLVDKSLLRFNPEGRYEMHELLRQYATEKLVQNPTLEATVRDRHCRWAMAFLHAQDQHLHAATATQGLDNIRMEIANLQAAWRWAVHQDRVDDLGNGLDGLADYYLFVGPFKEGEKLMALAAAKLEEALGIGDPSQTKRLITLGRIFEKIAAFQNKQGHYDQATVTAQRVIDIAAEIGDETRGIPLQARGYIQLGRAKARQGDSATARKYLEETIRLARAARLQPIEATGLRKLGVVFQNQGDFASASACYEEALTLCRQIGDRRGEASLLNNMGNVYASQGDPLRAMDFFNQAQEIYRDLGDRHIEGVVLHNMGRMALELDEYDKANAYLTHALQIFRQIGDRLDEGWVLLNIGRTAFIQGNMGHARSHLDLSLQIFREIRSRQGEALALINLGGLARQQLDYAQASGYLQPALHLCQQVGDRQAESWAHLYLAEVCSDQGAFQAARNHLDQALSISEDLGDQQTKGWALAARSLVLQYLNDGQAAIDTAQQALRIGQELGNQSLEATAWTNLGHILLRQKQIAQAADPYLRAARLRSELGQNHLWMGAQADLAIIHLAQGDPIQALNAIEPILLRVEIDNRRSGVRLRALDGLDAPFRVCLICYRILAANKDPRARSLLRKTYTWLHLVARRYVEPQRRQSFLEAVPAHREILAEAASHGL